MEENQYFKKNPDNQSALQDFVKQNQKMPSMNSAKKPLGKTNCYIIGVGGGGNNTINRLMSTTIHDVICICINTDLQHLNSVKCDNQLLIGKKITRGLGTGGKPELGKAAAEESYSEIQHLLIAADIVFLTCGLGGGTGTGAVPIVAEIAKNAGAIVIGVVTIPFSIEGNRKERAYKGLEELRRYSDTVVIIENDRLLELVPNLPIEEAFSVADEILANYIYSIITTISQSSLINVDFADLKSVITNGGVTVCGIGEAKGLERAKNAVEKALSNPLINVNYNLGTAALIHVTGGPTMTLKEASSVVEFIRNKLRSGAEIIWGAKVNPELGDLLRITFVISGVQSEQMIGMKKSSPISSSLNQFSMQTQVQVADQILPKEKENWLKRDAKPIIKEIRKKKEIENDELVKKSNEVKQKDTSEEFWEELGISKGLK